MFCALHDQLARYAQLTRCFSAVVELLVKKVNINTSQDSVASNLRCGKIFNYHLIAN